MLICCHLKSQLMINRQWILLITALMLTASLAGCLDSGEGVAEAEEETEEVKVDTSKITTKTTLKELQQMAELLGIDMFSDVTYKNGKKKHKTKQKLYEELKSK